MGFRIGQKVEFIEEWDIFPHALIKIGETGTVSSIDNDEVWVKLDKVHDALDYWENQAHLGFDERKPEDYIKVK